jgi:Putative Ig domain
MYRERKQRKLCGGRVMKKTLLLAILVCGSWLLHACGGGGNTPPSPPSITTTQAQLTAAVATAGTAFAFTFQATDTGAITWSALGLPADGLSLDMSSGVVSGIPTSKATVQFTLTAGDAQGHASPATMFTLSVSNPPPPSITTTESQLSAAPATIGISYSFIFTAAGGLAPLTWSATGLPPGLSFNAGVLSGVPTVAKSFTVTINVADQSVPPQTGSQNFTLAINAPPPLLITTPSPLSGGTAGVAYDTRISATGGVPPYSFSLAANSTPLPSSLSLISISNQGAITGIPSVAGTTSNIVIQVADSQAPAATSTMTYSLEINPPLPLAFLTTSPLQAGGVDIFYKSLISVTGGVGPYTFTLDSASTPLPAGLSLTATPGAISGIPSVAGTDKNIIVAVADSQSPPVTATMTYSLTINPSTLYVGTQAPGDVWQLGISHVNATNGVIGFQDQGSNGLAGPLGGANSLQFSTFPNGFISGIIGLFSRTAVEAPDEMVLFVPPVEGRLLGGATDRVVVAVANTCPQPTETTNYQFVALADEDFDLTKDAYGVAAVTQTSANSYNFALNSFTLEGATGTSNRLASLTCDSNLKVFSSTSATGIVSTVGISASGVMVIDNGTGIPAVGVQQPVANLPATAILGAQYLGTVFYANDKVLTVCPLHYSCYYPPAPATDLVGFGPGSASSISGGTYQKFSTDPFSAHGTSYTITLGTQIRPGLFTGGTLTIGTNTLPNFDVVVGQMNGKFVLFGVTLDNAVTPVQPYVVLLVQQ